MANPDQETAGESKKGKACLGDFDGDGVDDSTDVCPENPEIKHTDFSELKTMDLCERSNVTSNNFLLLYVAVFHSLEKSESNSCSKIEPLWEHRDEGKEIYQGRNSRVNFIQIKCHIK